MENISYQLIKKIKIFHKVGSSTSTSDAKEKKVIFSSVKIFKIIFYFLKKK